MNTHGLDYGTANAVLAYGITDACKVTGIGRTLMYSLIAGGKIEARRCGGRTLIPAASLEAFIASLPQADIRTGRNRTAA